MRAYSVCPVCGTVFVTATACPGCSGVADPLDAVRAARPAELPELKVTIGRAPFVGLVLGLGAFAMVVLLALMMKS
jgi:hypothetical protein